MGIVARRRMTSTKHAGTTLWRTSSDIIMAVNELRNTCPGGRAHPVNINTGYLKLQDRGYWGCTTVLVNVLNLHARYPDNFEEN